MLAGPLKVKSGLRRLNASRFLSEPAQQLEWSQSVSVCEMTPCGQTSSCPFWLAVSCPVLRHDEPTHTDATELRLIASPAGGRVQYSRSMHISFIPSIPRLNQSFMNKKTAPFKLRAHLHPSNFPSIQQA